MARPKGSKNFIPGEQERSEWLRVLSQRARAGDTTAIGLLVLLSELRERENRHHAA